MQKFASSQVLHSTSELNDYRILFLADKPPQALDVLDVNSWAQQFDSECVVDPIYNAVISPIWKGLTVTAVIQTSALVIVAVVVSVSSVVLVSSAIHGDLRKSSGSCKCCGCEAEGETDGDLNADSEDVKCCNSCTCCHNSAK